MSSRAGFVMATKVSLAPAVPAFSSLSSKWSFANPHTEVFEKGTKCREDVNLPGHCQRAEQLVAHTSPLSESRVCFNSSQNV